MKKKNVCHHRFLVLRERHRAIVKDMGRGERWGKSFFDFDKLIGKFALKSKHDWFPNHSQGYVRNMQNVNIKSSFSQPLRRGHRRACSYGRHYQACWSLHPHTPECQNSSVFPAQHCPRKGLKRFKCFGDYGSEKFCHLLLLWVVFVTCRICAPVIMTEVSE